MEPPVYNISTIDELFQVATEENVNRLCADLITALLAHTQLKKAAPDAVFRSMRWIDDGIAKTSATIKDHDPECKEQYLLTSTLTRLGDL